VTGATAGPILWLREPVSAGTHLAACLWAVFVARLLWRLAAADRGRQRAVGVFGLSLVCLYAASGTYHALPLPPDRLRTFLLLDHCAIYTLIAGTYTPIFATLLRPPGFRRGLVAAMWVMAAAGIACKLSLPAAPPWLNHSLYLAMGWLGLPGVIGVVHRIGLRAVTWGIVGGLCYTVGAFLDLMGWPVLYPGVVGPHELFHLLVIAGSLGHVIFIAGQVIPFPTGHARAADRPAGGDAAEPAPALRRAA
jgi:hemolysin III